MSLFREQAVRQYNDPDQRGGVLRTSAPSGVYVFAPLALLFVVAVVVAAVSKVHVTARGRGIVRPAAGLYVVEAPTSGPVSSTDVALGDTVAKGATLFAVDGVRVTAPVDGRIDALRVKDGEIVGRGTALARIVPSAPELVAYVAIAAPHRGHLAEGREVRLLLDEHSDAGAGVARVKHVSSEPIADGMADPFLLPGDRNAPHYQVELEPVAMPPRAGSGFRSGMTFTAEVVLREERILSLLLDE